MGYQSVAPHSNIRAHSHTDQVELQICFSGQGYVLVDGERHELVPGTACFLGPDVVHEIFNDTDEDLVQLWVIGQPDLKISSKPSVATEPAATPRPRISTARTTS